MAMRQGWCTTDQAALLLEGEGEPLLLDGQEEEPVMDDGIRGKERQRAPHSFPARDISESRSKLDYASSSFWRA